MTKSAYEARKRAGVCVDCGAKPLPGIIRCLVHQERSLARAARHRATPHYLSAQKKRRRRLYQELTDEGICPQCQKRPKASMTVMCEICAERDRNNKRAARGTKKQQYRCGICGCEGHSRLRCPANERNRLDLAEFATARNDGWTI